MVESKDVFAGSVEPIDVSDMGSVVGQEEGPKKKNSDESRDKNDENEGNNEKEGNDENEKSGENEGIINENEKVINLDINKKHLSKNVSKTISTKITKKIISFLETKWDLAFLIVLFMVLVIRLKYIGQESIWNDAAVHLWYTIKAIKEPLFFFSSEYLTGDYVTIQTLTALFYLFTKNLLIAGKIVAMLFGLLGIVFMYLLGTELKNKFVGLIAAALLGFNSLFWFYGVRLLADGPLVSMVVVIFYFFVKLEKEKKVKWGIWFGLSILAGILTKQQLIILPVCLVIYYLIHRRKEMFTNKAFLCSWLISFGLPFFGGLIMTFKGNNIFHQLFFEKLFYLKGMQTGFDSTAHFPNIFSWYLIILMIVGFLLMLLYKEKKYYFMAYFFIFYWWWLEIGNSSTENRYLLPLLPIGILFASFALIELSNYLVLFISKKKGHSYLRKGLIILFVIFVCWKFYIFGDLVIYYRSTDYLGYPEAGEWFKENVPDGTPIFVGSPRMMRAFIEREYGGPGGWDKGGSLWYLRDPKYLNNRTAFEEDLAMLSKKSDVYLEIDVWEYDQPKWYYDFYSGGITNNSQNYFESLGFQLVGIVEKEVKMKNEHGLHKKPVIFIFKKIIQADDSVKELARCLTDLGVELYSADYCVHCQEQKDMFADALEYLSIFDCTGADKIQDCFDVGVENVPAWKFPDGTIVEGMQSLSSLAKLSKCKYE